MTRRPLTVMLVGAGHIAARHAQAIETLGPAEVQVVGVADRSAAAAQSLAARFGCACASSCAELLDHRLPDVAVIATPPVSHAEDVVLCLGRCVHVLCEKPLTIDLDGLRDIEAAWHRTGARLSMASKYRHARDVVHARKLVAEGAIGRLEDMAITFARAVDMSARWNSHAPVSGGGVLMDNGPHAVDLARLFLGPIEAVRAARGPARSLPVEETVHLEMRGAGGARARAHLSWAETGAADDFLVLRGSQGTIGIGWSRSRVARASWGEQELFGKGFESMEGMTAQLRNFVRALRGEEDLVMRTEDALASVRVIHAAYRALEHDAWQGVANEFRHRPPGRGSDA